MSNPTLKPCNLCGKMCGGQVCRDCYTKEKCRNESKRRNMRKHNLVRK